MQPKEQMDQNQKSAYQMESGTVPVLIESLFFECEKTNFRDIKKLKSMPESPPTQSAARGSQCNTS